MKSILQNLTALLLSIIFVSSLASAIDNDETTLRKDLPKLLGSTNEGTEFFMTFHPCWETTGKADGCKIYISSAVATKVTVEIPGKEIFIQRTTIPNDIIEVSLTPEEAQCYRKDYTQPPKPHRVFKGYGIIVTAEDPIICYGVTRYENTSDGYLAIPTSALGKNYIVSSYNDPCQDNTSSYLTSYTSIVGVYNNTTVKVKLGGRFSNYTPGERSLKTGDSDHNTLNRGDVWLIGTMGDFSDLTGTTITANNLVSVISGNFCAFVPIQVSACDYLIEQDLPMESWGYKYHVAPIIKRKNGSLIRVLASEPMTIIYRDNNEWSLVKEVGGSEGSGYIERRTTVEGEGLRPVTISAKNPIAVTQYNCGQSDDEIESDPFQMSLLPTEQYQTNFIWCTPGINEGSSFRSNFVNLCYKSTTDGKLPDDVEFGKITNGAAVWKKITPTDIKSSGTFIDSSITDFRYYQFITLALEDPAGVYVIRGSEPMIAYGYGFDNYDSYGYPVAGCFNDFSKPDIWSPKPTYDMDCKGLVAGRVIEQPENDETLRSNMSSMNLIAQNSNNFSKLEYDKGTFFPSITSEFNWNLKVLDVESDAKATIRFTDRAGNDTTIVIDYLGTKLNAGNRIENWGSKAYNDPVETKELSILNESSKPVVLDSIILISKDYDKQWDENGFKIDHSIYRGYGGDLPGHTFQPGEEFKFNVTFNPQTLEKDIIEGKTDFADSIRVKANGETGNNSACYQKTIGVVKATIPAVSVEDLSGLTGIFDISPNPVSKKDVTVNYSVKFDGLVQISLYNTNGLLIKELVNSYQSQGSHSLSYPIEGLAQGTYFIELKAGEFVQHKNFVVVK